MSDSKTIEKFEANSGITVSTSTLAKIFGVTTKTIQNLTHDNVLEKSGRGSYILTKSVLAYVTYLKARTGTGEDSKSIELEKAEEDMKLKRAKREKAELELELAKGELITAKEVEQTYGNLVQTFRAKMLMLPVKVAPKTIGLKDVKTIQSIVEQEVNSALTELSKLTTDDLEKVGGDNETG